MYRRHAPIKQLLNELNDLKKTNEKQINKSASSFDSKTIEYKWNRAARLESNTKKNVCYLFAVFLNQNRWCCTHLNLAELFRFPSMLR